jgi:hypothetical protein
VSITGSGLYYLTFEKQQIDTAGISVESETLVKVALVLDAYTPNYDTHDFFNDVVANEASGTGYTTGGVAITSTELTVSSGVATYDAADPSWSSSTIASAMAAVGKLTVGSDATDMLLFLSDFVTAASTTAGTFTVQWAAGGIYTVDLVP